MDSQRNEEPLELLTDGVLTHLFNYLEISDLKNCRLVCKRWLSISELLFRNRTKVSLSFPSYDENEKTENADDADLINGSLSLREFFVSLTRNIPLTSLKMIGPIPWSVFELMKFFEAEGKYVTDLQLDMIPEERKKCSRLKNQLTTIITLSCNNILSMYVCRNLRSLNISNQECGHRVQYDIQISMLENIEFLCLRNVSIIIDAGGKISPKELVLEDNSYLCKIDGKYLTAVKIIFINGFISFESMKKFKLIHNDVKERSIYVDMSSRNNLELESVQLKGVNLRNWTNANWSIKELSFDEMNTQGNYIDTARQNMEMKVKEVTIRACKDIIRCLPFSIQKLTSIGNIKENPLTDSQRTVVFPYLTYLKADISDMEFFPVLKNVYCCTNIKDIEIDISKTDSDNSMTCRSLRKIPESVQRIKIHIGLENYELAYSRNLKLEVLALNLKEIQFLKPELLTQFLIKFKPDTIVIHQANYQWCSDRPNHVNVILDIIFTKGLATKCFIGEICWNKVQFKNSPFALCVDKQASYYCFQSGKGIKITKSDFDSVANF